MKKLIVPNGWHLCINQTPCIVNTQKASLDVIFDNSCVYNTGIEQLDWLKMPVGFSIGLLPKGLLTKPMHHNSIRFGWRYSTVSNKIEVAPYWYINGVRHYAEKDGQPICSLKLNTKFTFQIEKMDSRNGYSMWVFNEDHNLLGAWNLYFEGSDESKLGWSANLYFGGTAPAPHKVTMQVK